MKTITTTLVLIEEVQAKESYDKDHLQGLINEYGLGLYSGTDQKIVVTNIKVTGG